MSKSLGTVFALKEIFERATKVLGHKPLLLLSSWSPPADLKASGKERCKSNDDCTLKKEKGKFVYEGFAKYWAYSVAFYRKLGLAPDFVSIKTSRTSSRPTGKVVSSSPKRRLSTPATVAPSTASIAPFRSSMHLRR
jgi:hypothetical protein